MEKLPIGAYVLAGGRSTRMGQDKAQLLLAGKPLIQRVVQGLRRLTDEVYILGSRPELSPFASLVADLHPNCGPLGGMEAALAHTRREWILVLPVDMPLLPRALLERWIRGVLPQNKARVALFVIDGMPQPALCLLHQEVMPFVVTATQQGRFKLYPVLEEAARALAHRDSVSLDETLLCQRWARSEAASRFDQLKPAGEEAITPAQRLASPLWFANLNTPEEFAEAQGHLDALDPLEETNSRSASSDATIQKRDGE